jgi:hypothetical protein
VTITFFLIISKNSSEKDASGCKESKSKISPSYLNSSYRYSSFDYFRFFLKVHIYLQLLIDNLCIVDSPNLKKFRSVKIFKLSFRVSETRAFLFIYF